MTRPGVHVVVFRPEGFSPHSGLEPIAQELGARGVDSVQCIARRWNIVWP